MFFPLFQRLAVVPFPLAHLAGDVDVGEEVHLDFDDAVAVARVAPAAADVEREAPRFVTPRLRRRELAEQLADGVEDFGIRGRVGAGRPAYGLLVDLDDFIDSLYALQAVVLAGAHRPA